MQINIRLSTQKEAHSRVSYNLLDLFGDLGGVLEVLTILLHVMIAPWVEFTQMSKALRSLYLIKTAKYKGDFKKD